MLYYVKKIRNFVWWKKHQYTLFIYRRRCQQTYTLTHEKQPHPKNIHRKEFLSNSRRCLFFVRFLSFGLPAKLDYVYVSIERNVWLHFNLQPTTTMMMTSNKKQQQKQKNVFIHNCETKSVYYGFATLCQRGSRFAGASFCVLCVWFSL